MEEEKVVSFTTQNSFLHYGVKGMKWGVITSLYEKVGRQSHGRAETARRNSPGYQNAGKNSTVTNSYDAYHPNPRQKNVTGRGTFGNTMYIHNGNKSPVNKSESVSGGPVGKSGGYGKSREVEKGKKDAEKEKKNTMRITDEEMAKNAIETSNAHARGEMIGDDKEKETITAFDGIDEFSEKDARARIGYKDGINKYVNAMDSISDMDPKYEKQFFDKYGSKMTTEAQAYATWTNNLYDDLYYSESVPDDVKDEILARKRELQKDSKASIENSNDLVRLQEGITYDEELLEKALKYMK